MIISLEVLLVGVLSVLALIVLDAIGEICNDGRQTWK